MNNNETDASNDTIQLLVLDKPLHLQKAELREILIQAFLKADAELKCADVKPPKDALKEMFRLFGVLDDNCLEQIVNMTPDKLQDIAETQADLFLDKREFLSQHLGLFLVSVALKSTRKAYGIPDFQEAPKTAQEFYISLISGGIEALKNESGSNELGDKEAINLLISFHCSGYLIEWQQVNVRAESLRQDKLEEDKRSWKRLSYKEKEKLQSWVYQQLKTEFPDRRIDLLEKYFPNPNRNWKSNHAVLIEAGLEFKILSGDETTASAIDLMRKRLERSKQRFDI